MQSLLRAQKFDVTRAIAAQVELDSVVITATRGDFAIEDFIRLVQDDESLYQAFHQLRSASYVFSTEMQFYDRKGRIESSYTALHRQDYDGRCRSMVTLHEADLGRIFKGRNHIPRYYTFRLYDRLFLTHGVECAGAGGRATGKQSKSGIEPSMEHHVEELKTLIFRPGEHAEIPFIGKKTALFSEDMLDDYDFSIRSDEFRGIPAYVFTASVKPELRNENAVVFQLLQTWFSREDFQVLAREYILAQHTFAYFFDVQMHVGLLKIGNRYYPELIRYGGSWNIPGKRKETATFTVEFSEFQ